MSEEKNSLVDLLVGMPPKPDYGEPCNGCGFCCAMEPCVLAKDIVGCTEGPCTAMEQEGNRMVCGLVKRPAYYMFGQDVPESETGWLSSMFAAALGFGVGCDADNLDN